jgi:uncharacterized membrane protein
MKNTFKDPARKVLALIFVCTGILHFIRPKTFIAITPEFLPKRREIVYASGVFEILGGLGLLFPFTRRFAAKGLVTLLYAVFPANLNMAINKIDLGYIPKWLLWARLPMQFLLISGVNLLAEDAKEK